MLAFSVLAMAVLAAPKCDLKLIPSASTIQPGRSFQIALRFAIESKWHIYWQNPGDTGVPTEVKWTLPPGFKVQKVQWSAPTRVENSKIVSYGLEGEAYAIATILAPAAAANVAVKANADWLICRDVCVEDKGSAVTLLSAAPGTPKPNPDFRKALASLPLAEHALLFKAVADSKNYRLEVRHRTHKGVGPKWAYFFAFSDSMVNHSAAQTMKQIGGMFTLTLPRSRFEKGTVKRLRGILEMGSSPRDQAAFVVDVPIS